MRRGITVPGGAFLAGLVMSCGGGVSITPGGGGFPIPDVDTLRISFFNVNPVNTSLSPGQGITMSASWTPKDSSFNIVRVKVILRLTFRGDPTPRGSWIYTCNGGSCLTGFNINCTYTSSSPNENSITCSLPDGTVSSSGINRSILPKWFCFKLFVTAWDSLDNRVDGSYTTEDRCLNLQP